MKTTMGNLTGALLLIATAGLGSARSQGTEKHIRLGDLRAQQPRETIAKSAVCQRARENTRESPNHVFRRDHIDPETLVTDPSALMEKSDEVVLAAVLDSADLLSPSGESVASYFQARVIRSWKGTLEPSDEFTFGVPGGTVDCTLSGSDHLPFTVLPGVGSDWQGVHPGSGWEPYVYVLFLRQSAGNETQLVQGLRLAAGNGVQGMFLIHVPVPTDRERYCAAVMDGSVQHCQSYLQTSQSAVIVPYARDPLAKKYAGMPASVFLQEVQSVAAAQGFAQKSPPK